MDAGIHAEMTHWVSEEQRLRREAAQIKEDGPLWEGRLEQAQRAGRDDLVQVAQEKLDGLRRRLFEIRDELEIVKEEQRQLKMEARTGRGDGEHRVARAEALLEDFKNMGIDPEAGMLNREIKNNELDAEVAALRARMSGDD